MLNQTSYPRRSSSMQKNNSACLSHVWARSATSVTSVLPTLLCSWRLRAATLKPGYGLVSVVGAAFIPGSGCERDAPTSVRLHVHQAAHHGNNTQRRLCFSVAQPWRRWHRPVCLDEQTSLQRRLADHLAEIHMQSFGELRESHGGVDQDVSA